MRDMSHNIGPVLSLSPAARTASANGTAVDLLGFGEAAVLVTIGTWTDGTHTPKLQESDNGTSGWTDVAAGDLIGGFSVVNSAGGGNAVQRVSYIGNKRYIRAVLTVASATNGAFAGVLVVRGNPASAPVA
ncbi:Phage protein [Roseomonas mucosa]|uniref:Phage protein n=1 Tax=Roseomonas mucosa TaxID=207340 RepID=A0A4Y1N138_9PROT|nr:hypothetical protein [Roseomonas mucosa]AWV23925.1 Phage protein [Roseomonas mucosa]MDT8277380.1 hypothetical protein [Roseomonas mucosa]MDT8356413.1 hypothetical protein [Roseomonas mucosa]MDU7524706.1 hypothetical protein [Roseomonas mucosa]QDJ10870.1 Phage protein [Roseomonas mucosa]